MVQVKIKQPTGIEDIDVLFPEEGQLFRDEFGGNLYKRVGNNIININVEELAKKTAQGLSPEQIRGMLNLSPSERIGESFTDLNRISAIERQRLGISQLPISEQQFRGLSQFNLADVQNVVGQLGGKFGLAGSPTEFNLSPLTAGQPFTVGKGGDLPKGLGIGFKDFFKETPDSISNEPITSSALQSTPDFSSKITIPRPIIPDSASSLDIPASRQPVSTPTEDLFSGSLSKLDEINKRLSGKATFTAGKEAEFGVPELETEFSKLGQQLRDLQREEQSIPINIQREFQGRGATAAGLAPITSARLRDNAIRALTVSSLIDAANLNLTNAQRKVERAVEQQFDPIIAEKEALLENLDLVLRSGQLDREEKRRAESAQAFVQAQKQQIEEAKQTKTDILNIANDYSVSAVNAGVYKSDIAQKIQKATTLEEAMNLRDSELAKIAPPSTDLQEEIIGDFRVLRDASGKVISTREVEKESKDIQFISGTANQPAGIFNKNTGVFTPLLPSTVDGSDIDIPDAEFGTPEFAYNEIVKSAQFGDKRLNDSRLEKLDQAQLALGGVQSLNSLLLQGNDGINLTGPVKGRVRSLVSALGGDADASAINATIQGLIPTVARGIFGEVGVLTDTDINNYKKTITNLTSTEAQNRLVSVIMLDVLSRSYENTLLNSARNQTNVSGFAQSYLDIRQRIENEKLKLGVTQFSGLGNDELLESIPETKTVNDFRSSFNAFMNIGSQFNFPK